MHSGRYVSRIGYSWSTRWLVNSNVELDGDGDKKNHWPWEEWNPDRQPEESRQVYEEVQRKWMRKTEEVNTQGPVVGQYPGPALLVAPVVAHQWIRRHKQPHPDNDFTVQIFLSQ